MIPARPACSVRRATTADAGGILGCLRTWLKLIIGQR